MSKIIQDSDIETIKKLLLNRNSYSEIKNILDNLDNNSQDFKLDESQVPKTLPQELVTRAGNLGDVSGCPDILKEEIKFLEDTLILGDIGFTTRDKITWRLKELKELQSQQLKSSILNDKAQDLSDGVINRSSVEQTVDSNIQDILKDILDLRNHHGKSSIIDADLDKIINKYSD